MLYHVSGKWYQKITRTIYLRFFFQISRTWFLKTFFSPVTHIGIPRVFKDGSRNFPKGAKLDVSDGSPPVGPGAHEWCPGAKEKFQISVRYFNISPVENFTFYGQGHSRDSLFVHTNNSRQKIWRCNGGRGVNTPSFNVPSGYTSVAAHLFYSNNVNTENTVAEA